MFNELKVPEESVYVMRLSASQQARWDRKPQSRDNIRDSAIRGAVSAGKPLWLIQDYYRSDTLDKGYTPGFLQKTDG